MKKLGLKAFIKIMKFENLLKLCHNNRLVLLFSSSSWMSCSYPASFMLPTCSPTKNLLTTFSLQPSSQDYSINLQKESQFGQPSTNQVCSITSQKHLSTLENCHKNIFVRTKNRLGQSIASIEYSSFTTGTVLIENMITYGPHISRRFCSGNASNSHQKSIDESDSSSSASSPATTSEPLNVTIKLSISFSNGYFSLRFASCECLFHFWSPIELFIKMFQEELASLNASIDENIEFDQKNIFNTLEIELGASSSQTQTFRFDRIKFGRIEMVAEHHEDITSGSESSTDSESFPLMSEQPRKTASPKKHRYRLARLMPFGYALLGCDIDEVYLIGTGTATITIEGPDGHSPSVSKPLKIIYKMVDKTKTLRADIETWHQQNPLDSQTMLFKAKTIDPNLFEQNELAVRFLISLDQTKPYKVSIYKILQQERQLLLEKFAPLQQEFSQLVQTARKESRRKFKFGGLFLLSAQLGFVGRLTYFEYSWDIMEPVTWIMTYTTMIGSFAYYIITSEEYVVPMVEKRMIASRFWQLAQSRQFNVQQYQLLKDELRQLEERIAKLRPGI